MITNSQLFIQFALNNNVLSFGEFTTKAGRVSPYFFNAGKFNTGISLWSLAQFYAKHILEQNIDFDVLFGPAYKGITLASSVACALSCLTNKDIPFTFNRKEVKEHGEGGILVGSSLENKKVLIIDDVISAGTSIKQSIDIINLAHGTPIGIIIALDRMEKSGSSTEIGHLSAIQEIEQNYNLPIYAITNLRELLDYVADNQKLHQYKQSIQDYKLKYGI